MTDQTPLTAEAFRRELRRHRWATWWGLVGLLALVAVGVSMWVTGSQ